MKTAINHIVSGCCAKFASVGSIAAVRVCLLKLSPVDIHRWRIAARYEKTARNFLAVVHLAAALTIPPLSLVLN